MSMDRQIGIIKEILAANDEQIHDRKFMLHLVKEYGIAPLAWLMEMDGNVDYTENGMIQVPGEFVSFCQFISDYRIETAAEVGVYRGRSSYFICAILYRKNPELQYDMIDIEDNLDGFEEFRKVLPCLRKCIPSTSAVYKKQKYDFVFIDADHSYEGAMDDYLKIGRYAKRMVCFHDIYAHEYDSQNGGVVRCWNEVCALTPQHTKMVFSQFPNRWMGIGVVINDTDEKTIGCEGDYERIQEKVIRVKEEIDNADEVYIYGARNDSRRMHDALRRNRLNVQGLIIGDDTENPEDVKSYNIFKLKDVEEKSNVAIIICYRESLQKEVIEKLKKYKNVNMIITDDKVASFM